MNKEKRTARSAQKSRVVRLERVERRNRNSIKNRRIRERVKAEQQKQKVGGQSIAESTTD